GERAGSSVQLPGLVGELGCETDEGGARSLVRLGSDQAVAFEDPPHGCDRGHPLDLANQMMGDGIRPRIVTGIDQLLAQSHDSGLDFRRCLVRTGTWSAGAGL